MKKSFILYLDQKELFDKLPDEQAGKLTKHIFSYVNCENPVTDDLLVDIAFSSVKSALKRDLKKWETQLEQRREAGKRSAEARAKRKSTSVNERSISSNEPQRNPTDSVNVSVNVNDSVINNDIYQQIADAWNRIFNNELSLVSKITQKRKSAINGCIQEMKGTEHDFTKIETWESLFEYAKGLDFLMGRKTEWSMNFDFITTKSKLLKVVEGSYDNQ